MRRAGLRRWPEALLLVGLLGCNEFQVQWYGYWLLMLAVLVWGAVMLYMRGK